MITCGHCRHSFEVSEPAELVACPHCRSEVEVPGDGQWVSVARTVQLAEAGYLANELDSAGFYAQVEQHDSFSAVDGSWQCTFLIQVGSEDAQQAAQLIAELLQDCPVASAVDYTGRRFDEGEAVDHAPVIWRPLALMLVAGAAILFIGNRMRDLRGQPRDPVGRGGLMEALQRIDRPFVSEGVGQRGSRFRFWYSQQNNHWHLQEDVNGDEIYDREWVFAEPAGRP